MNSGPTYSGGPAGKSPYYGDEGMDMGRPRRRVRWIWIVVVLALIGGGGYAFRLRGNAGASAQVPEGVQVATAERGTLRQRISATGVVAAQTGAMVKIGSQITGRIRSLPADVGTRVNAGQVVAVLDLPDLEAQVEQQRQSVAAAEASLKQAESRLRQAALSAGFTKEQTDSQIAEAQAALHAAERRVESSAATAKLQPAQTTAEIARAQAALSTARSHKQQVEQTLAQQILQAESSINEAQAQVDNTSRTLQRQESLFKQGFIAAQELDNGRAAHRQATARLDSAKANLDIVRSRTRTDVQAADDRVREAQANLTAAEAGKLQNAVRDAELRAAQDSLKQAAATVKLRQASRSADRIGLFAAQEARSALTETQASLLRARAQLRFQLAQQDKSLIRSPINGTVLSITAQQGETVAAGFSAPTLITVADLNRLEVRAYVDETDIGKVRLNLSSDVRVEAFPGRVFRGRVVKIASASTVRDNVVTYETTIALENAGGILRPDMTADVELVLGERKDVVLVPIEAVHREMERSIVYVLDRKSPPGSQVKVRAVQPGVDDGIRAEINSGLAVGEEVVLAGLPRLGVHPPDAQSGRPGSRK